MYLDQVVGGVAVAAIMVAVLGVLWLTGAAS
jgi:hypothetical protein